MSYVQNQESKKNTHQSGQRVKRKSFINALVATTHSIEKYCSDWVVQCILHNYLQKYFT